MRGIAPRVHIENPASPKCALPVSTVNLAQAVDKSPSN